MVKQIIDVGIIGNDATGDPIRDAFSKTNENFDELYAALGNSGGLSFTSLTQTPNTLVPDNLLITNHTGTALLQKEIIAGTGLEIDNSDPSKIRFINSGASVVSDKTPALGGSLDARGNIIYNLPDPSQYSTLQSQLGLISQDNFAVSKKYADLNYVPITGSPIVSVADLVVGQFYAIQNLGTTTNSQWNQIAGTVGIQYEVGTDFICREVGINFGTGAAYVSMSGFLSVPPGGTITHVPQRQEVVLKSGDSMLGSLLLAADPNAASNPLQAATKNYVDTTSHASTVDFFVSTTGDDYYPNLDESKKGRAYAYSFKSIARACAAAEKIQSSADTELGPYQKQIVYTVGQIVTGSTIYAITQIGSTSEYYLDITHGGIGTDSRTGSNYSIRAGHLIRGNISGATVIIDLVGAISTAPNIERYTVRFLNSSTFITGETINYGDPIKASQITIHIESGEYYEHLPIRVPRNVSVVGDELRRVIIRPKRGISSSYWANTFFRRDITFDSTSPMTIVNSVTVGGFTVGLPYTIKSLGTTTNGQWNTIAGTTGQFYDIGSTFIAANTGDGLGNGSAYSPYGYHYLLNPGKSNYSKTITNPGSFVYGQKLIYQNKSFITAEALGYINDYYRNVVTGSSSNSNSFICLSNTNLNVGMPIRFSQLTTYITNTDSATDRINVGSTSGMIAGQSIVFVGTGIGGIISGQTYYILSIVSSTSITIGNSYPGVVLQLITDSGFMTATVTSPLIGGVNASQTYYVLSKIGSTTFTISDTINGNVPGSIVALSDSPVGSGSMLSRLYLDQTSFAGDIDSITDAIGFDFLYGGSTKTSEVALNFFNGINGLSILDLLPQYTQTLTYLSSLIANVLAQTSPTVSYQHTTTPVAQVTGLTSAETGTVTAKLGLIQKLKDIINSDSSFNFAKNNDVMDVFLMDDATLLRLFTCQGHGGFMAVLDPVGQILNKSPFIEICASFSKSTNAQTFAGGIFVDGYTANVACTIISKIDTATIQVYSSIFSTRLPRVPCSFYVNGIRFEVDYITDYNSSNNTAILHFNNLTQDISSYTNLPTGTVLTNQLWIELVTAGNRSMVTTHFTNINDLGYSIVATNNALIEAVSLFTYYNYRSFYALNGSQIRSLNGSSAYGVYGITAEGSDPSEIPTAANLYYPMTQVLTVYRQGAFSTAGNVGDLSFYLTGFSYPATNISGLEIDHNGIITEYQINTISPTSIVNVYQITLSSASSSSISLSQTVNGLLYAITDGQPVIVRSLQGFKFNNVLQIDPIRPSTALQFDGDADVYRVLSYTGIGQRLQESVLNTSTSYNYIKVLTDPSAGTLPNTGQTGDYQVLIEPNLAVADVSRIIGKTFAWGTSVHTIVGYESITITGAGYCRITLDSPLTKSTLNASGQVAIQTYSRNSSGVVTVNCTSHGLSSLNYINISGTGVTGIDTIGEFVKPTIINANQFTYQSTVNSTLATSSGGYVTGIASTIDLRSGQTNKQYLQINTVARNNNVATVSTITPHNLKVGYTVNILQVRIFGNPSPGYNATNAIVTSVSTDGLSFTYANAGSNLSSSTATTGALINSTAFTITSISRSSNLSTVTTTVAHNLKKGDTINIVNSDYNLTILGTSSSDNSITITYNYSDGGYSGATTTGLVVGMPIVFAGSGLFGTNITVGVTYYIKSIISSTKISISTTPLSGEFNTFGLATAPNASGTAAAGYGFGTLAVDIISSTNTTFIYENAGADQSTVTTLSNATVNPIFPTIARITLYISLTRCTGHDFLSIGVGGYADTKYPNNIYGPSRNKTNSANQVIEIGKGRCFYTATDQSGNFSVGSYFSVDQGTGTVKFASSIVLTNLDGLGFKRGVAITAFDADDTMLNNATDEVPTQSAVVGYINKRLGVNDLGVVVSSGTIGPGYIARNGVLPMMANFDVGSHRIVNLSDPISLSDAATKAYVNSSVTGLLPTSGGTMTGNINMGNNNITNINNLDMNNHTITSVAVPVNSSDAANKAYVDSSNASINQLNKLQDTSIQTLTSYNVTSASVPVGAGPYLVTFTIPSQTTAPITGIGYTVAGNSNSSFNGNFAATASTTSSITLSYPINPGIYGTGSVTITTIGMASADYLIWNGNYWVNTPLSGSISNTLNLIPLSQISRSSSVSTVVTRTSHGLNTGDRISLTGIITPNNINPGFNGSFAVTRVDAVTFTFSNTGTDFSNVTALVGSASATSSTNNYILLSSTSNMTINNPIYFTGSSIGNIVPNRIYYIKSITTQTAITIAQVSRSGTTVTVNTGTTPFNLLSFTSKVAVGDGTFRLTFTISVTPAPTNSVSYLVSGNSNTNYNGSFVAYSTSTTSITLIYPSDPGTYGTGTTTAQYLSTHGLSNGQVVTISGTGLVDQANVTVTVINGTQFSFTSNISGTIIGTVVNNAFATPQPQITISSTIGGTVITQSASSGSMSFTASLVGYAQILSSSINSSVITNNMVSSNAAIDQTKLNLLKATTGLNTVISPVTFGIAAFDSTYFTSTSGFVSLASNSVALSNISSIASGNVLGNISGSIGNVNTVPVTSSTVNNTLVLRDSSGNFSANIITASLTGTVTGNIIGGTASTSSLTLQSTSGNGITDTILFKVGNNGAVTALTISNTLTDIILNSSYSLAWDNGSGTVDLVLNRLAANSLRIGQVDSSSPLTQTISVPSVAAGNINLSGVNFTIKGSAGTGSGAGGSIIFQVAGAGGSGAGQNPFAAALTLDSTKLATFGAGANFSGTVSATTNYTTTPASQDAGRILSLSNTTILTGANFGVSDSRIMDVGIGPSNQVYLRTAGANGLLISGASLTVNSNILPSTNSTYNLGSATYSWATLYGNATSANYADLAENYEGDKEYEPGTVVMIGGEKEVTLANGYATTKVAGVVSHNPAHLMNAQCPGIQVAVALQGRVPTKVVGKIRKGDILTVGVVPGVAQSNENPTPGSIIGKALADYDSDKIGLIEVLVGKH